ncbi:MAG TPA: CPBP family intramembrane metalloprotease [Intrasporangiaceae bacterium]|nr:CPBP family intramembrane metalloprotease [Intrasporangiaceae bacterium]
MAYVKNSKGVGYSDPGFLEHFIWILLGLATATVLYCVIFRRDASIPFAEGRRWGAYAIVMAPIVVLFAVGMVIMFKASWTFFAPIVATLLVGIGEEIAFRQVLFGALLKRSAHQGRTVVGAVLVSALAFSALHAVNVLGGESVRKVAIQMVLTFLAGILFAVLYLQTKSLLALILFHWLWDAVTFFGLEKTYSWLPLVMVLLTVLQSVIGLVLLLRYRTVKAQSVLDPMPAHSN